MESMNWMHFLSLQLFSRTRRGEEDDFNSIEFHNQRMAEMFIDFLIGRNEQSQIIQSIRFLFESGEKIRGEWNQEELNWETLLLNRIERFTENGATLSQKYSYLQILMECSSPNEKVIQILRKITKNRCHLAVLKKWIVNILSKNNLNMENLLEDRGEEKKIEKQSISTVESSLLLERLSKGDIEEERLTRYLDNQMHQKENRNQAVHPATEEQMESITTYLHQSVIHLNQLFSSHHQSSLKWTFILPKLQSLLAFFRMNQFNSKFTFIFGNSPILFFNQLLSSFVSDLVRSSQDNEGPILFDALVIFQLYLIAIEEWKAGKEEWMETIGFLYKFFVIMVEKQEVEMKKLYSSDLPSEDSSPLVKLKFLTLQIHQKQIHSENSCPSVKDLFLLCISKLSTKFFDEIYPKLSHSNEENDQENSEGMSKLSIEESNQNEEEYGKELRGVIKLMDCIGWETESHFERLYLFFSSFLPLDSSIEASREENQFEDLDPEEIASRQLESTIGLTNLFLKRLLKREHEDRSKPSGNGGLYSFVPRARDLFFLSNNIHGEKIAQLQALIDISMLRSQHSFQFGLHSIIEDLFNYPAEKGSLAKLSPYHVHLERFPSRIGLQPYYHGQLSISHIKSQLNEPSSFSSENETPLSNISDTCVIQFNSFVRFLQSKLSESGAIIFKRQAAQSLLILSDLFQMNQFESTLDLFLKLYESDDIEDFLIRYYLLIGICKCATVISNIKSGTSSVISRLIRSALEEEEPLMHLAAFNGILYLVQVTSLKLLNPILQFLFKWLISYLNLTDKSTQLRLHAMSVTFSLIEEFPVESEEHRFAFQAVQIILSQALLRDSSIPIVNCAYRGLARLLISASLDANQREAITSFASTKNKTLLKMPVVNTIRSMIALSLLVTCIYSEDAHENKQEKDRSLHHMDNTERMKLCFAKMEGQAFPNEKESLLRIIPLLLEDLFTDEESLSFLLGEFARQTNSGIHQEFTALVIFEVFRFITQRGFHASVVNWILICLPNFVLSSKVDLGIWAMTCLFLAISEDFQHRCLFQDVVVKMSVNESLFITAATDYYTGEGLSETDRETFIATFQKSEHPFIKTFLQNEGESVE
eukprot:TRINITY_DN1606_c0_g3_i1.p1 TRINITY_DN1606_c0_g3~~TRINITY_DN1606_c0_g3_i1.p1  ORF type:complete len:1104 (+),score=493.54 TRINITY_DN1606_c0_g3_i1:154-3465(+)